MSAKLKSFVSRPTLAFAVAALSCLAFADRSNATTVNSNFTVQVTVNSTCIINSSNNMDFGPVGVLTANVDATSTLSVQCTNTTPYDIGLNAGTGSGATVATRKITNGVGHGQLFTLYRFRAHDRVGQYDQHGYRARDRQRRRAGV
jgi:spore coat protein U-like protein